MAKSISSPVPDVWYPTLSVFMLCIGLFVTASFFIYEATSSTKNRSLAKELTTGAVASVFLLMAMEIPAYIPFIIPCFVVFGFVNPCRLGVRLPCSS
ncbi:transmembrane 258 [Olea europaea subsp. europaea]|uniref:Dolichyl-diphosphooligosaccharide-protein glycosyltransferase subunit OST5 n=1 Tax=Olea europaea subsp. europaea TaxID=158383 RepID=A0A8S0UTY6_OLEEU|nr:transmembrane 258 [Olea europaea subsp. europaea]